MSPVLRRCVQALAVCTLAAATATAATASAAAAAPEIIDPNRLLECLSQVDPADPLALRECLLAP